MRELKNTMTNKAEKTNGNNKEQKNRKETPGLIEPHGGYQNLKSYQMSEIVYDAATVFCDRFIDRRSRTHDHGPGRAERQTEHS